MAEDSTGTGTTIPKAPLGAVAVTAALVLAGAVYAITSRGGETEESGSKGKSGNVRKRLGLMTAIAVIENDTTRKLLLATLRAMAKRA